MDTNIQIYKYKYYTNIDTNIDKNTNKISETELFMKYKSSYLSTVVS
jgi:hypothetical protein